MEMTQPKRDGDMVGNVEPRWIDRGGSGILVNWRLSRFVGNSHAIWERVEGHLVWDNDGWARVVYEAV
jgi:hypothetical protein